MKIDEVDESAWEDRMNRANYNPEQRSLVNQCLKKKEKFLQFFMNAAWEVTDNNKKEGIVVSQCMSDSGVPALKSQGTLPFPIMQVFACLHDGKYRPMYDDNIEKASVLQKVAANCYYIYQKTKSMFIVSSRDLVLAHHVARIQHP